MIRFGETLAYERQPGRLDSDQVRPVGRPYPHVVGTHRDNEQGHARAMSSDGAADARGGGAVNVNAWAIPVPPGRGDPRNGDGAYGGRPKTGRASTS